MAFHWNHSQHCQVGAMADEFKWRIIRWHFIAAAANGISVESRWHVIGDAKDSNLQMTWVFSMIRLLHYCVGVEADHNL